MDFEAWFVVGVLLGLVITLASERLRPDIALLGALGLLLVGGVLEPGVAFAGFASPAVVALASLFVLASGVERSPLFQGLHGFALSPTSSYPVALIRMMGSVAALSAVVNNTPIVAILIPKVRAWCRERGFNSSALLIPLSYAAIVGGTSTLVGTSTNVVVSEVSVSLGGPSLSFFEFAWVGIPITFGTLLFFVAGGWRLLPSRDSVKSEKPEEALFDVAIQAGGIEGLTVRQAGLRNLTTGFLAHVSRSGTPVPATPETVLRSGDVLTFVGPMELRDELLSRPGLGPSKKHEAEEGELVLFHAIVAGNSTLAGSTLRAARFRQRYGGVVIGVQRRNELVGESLGTIRLSPGDMLTVESDDGFSKRVSAEGGDFYAVFRRGRPTPIGRSSWTGAILLAGVVGVVASGMASLATASFIAAIYAIVSGVVSTRRARSAIDTSVLIIVGSALGLGQGISAVGLDRVMADFVLEASTGLGLVGALVILYVATNILTELITHKASAVLMVPVALELATQSGIPSEAALLTTAAAAASSFITPVGYQTNTMVLAPGSYRFKDFVKVGVPVSLLALVVTLAVMSARFG